MAKAIIRFPENRDILFDLPRLLAALECRKGRLAVEGDHYVATYDADTWAAIPGRKGRQAEKPLAGKGVRMPINGGNVNHRLPVCNCKACEAWRKAVFQPAEERDTDGTLIGGRLLAVYETLYPEFGEPAHMGLPVMEHHDRFAPIAGSQDDAAA
jgi:hypothetical protein